MLADQLIARAQRCAELNHMLAENADHEDAPDWIAEIALKALNRREDRHVAIVRSVQRIRNKIALFDDLPEGNLKRLQLARLNERITELGASPELLTREDVING